MREGYRTILMLAMISSGPVSAALNIPAATPSAADATTTAVAASPATHCEFAALPGLEFAFAELDASMSPSAPGDEAAAAAEDTAGHYVLWRRKPSPVAPPLEADYGGRRGKVTGRYFWNLGERWITAQLDDCSEVYAMDTSRNTSEGPLMHLESVGRIYYLTHLDFARSLIGSSLRVNAASLEPNQRLYPLESDERHPLLPGDVLEVLGVETRRFGYTKGIGGFYLGVRNQRGEEGLVKFHHDYLTGLNGEFLWSLQPDREGNGAVLVYQAGAIHAAE